MRDGPASKPGFVAVGQIVGVFGLKGRVKVMPLTDFQERFDAGKYLFLRDRKIKILECAWHKNQARLQLQGLSTPEQAEELRWEYLFAPELEKPVLPEGEFLVSELIGMSVLTEDGELLGQLEEVLPGLAQDQLIVSGISIPCAKEFVRSISKADRKIVVRLIPGMRTEEE